MTQHQPAIAGEIDVDHLDIGIDEADVVLLGQFTPDAAITTFIVDGIDLDASPLLRIVMQVEHAEMPHQPRTEVLTDKAFVAIIGPDVAQDAHHVAVPGDLRKPLPILVIRIGNDTLNVLHHRKAERIGVEAGEARIVEIRLEYDVGVRLQEFEEIAVGDPSLFVQPLHDAVMDVGRGALVHHLGLALRIEILRDVPHDPKQLALPGLQAWRGLLKEVQQVFLRQSEQFAAALDVEHRIALCRPGRNRPPQIVERGLLVQTAPAGALFLGTKVELLLAGVTVDPVRHQRMRGVERLLDREPALALLALRHVGLGEFEIVENAVGIGPLLEQIVVLEEMVVAERRMRDHQRLHGRGVFLHQVGNAGR